MTFFNHVEEAKEITLSDYPPPQTGERYRRKGGHDYIVALNECTCGMTLVNLATGYRYSNHHDDPFGGDRAGFVRIDEHGKEIVPPIKLIEGHEYELSDGRKTGPLRWNKVDATDLWTWYAPMVGYYGMYFREDGTRPRGLRIVKDLGTYQEPIKLVEGYDTNATTSQERMIMRLGVRLDDGAIHWFHTVEDALKWYLDKGYIVSDNIGYPNPIPAHIQLLYLIKKEHL